MLSSGKAPSGFGLGGDAKNINGQDLNTIKSFGVYFWEDAVNAPFAYGYMIVIPSYGEGLTQLAWSLYDTMTGSMVQRTLQYYSTWSNWEWSNPPMDVDVEYRLTERWNGEPLYAKLINLGTLPNNDVKWLEDMPLPMNITVLSAFGIARSDLKTIAFPTMHIYMSFDGEWGTIYLKTDNDYSAYTAFAIVKYVKN